MIEKLEVISDKYTARVVGDREGGKAYSVEVCIDHDFNFIDTIQMQNETYKIAAQELGIDLRSYRSWLSCDSSRSRTKEIAKCADDIIRPRLFVWVRVTLAPEKQAEIISKYPDAQGIGYLSVEGWVRKSDLNADR